MPAGATCAITGADTDQQTGNRQRQPAAVDLNFRQTAKQLPEQRREQYAQQKQTLLAPPFTTLKQTAEQATDAGHPAIHYGKQAGGQANQCATSQGAPRCEVVPIDTHCSPAQNS